MKTGQAEVSPLLLAKDIPRDCAAQVTSLAPDDVEIRQGLIIETRTPATYASRVGIVGHWDQYT